MMLIKPAISIRLLYFLRLISLLICTSFLISCTTVAYYSQSISGQLHILLNRKPIDHVIQDSDTSEELKRKLSLIEDIRVFATQQLSLPDKGSYHSYTDTNRNFVVWNIFATPEFSLEPLRWCFLFVGCLSYRGYFNKSQADEYASALAARGLDVYMGGVTAYSTLGWFNDPVLNTMLERDELQLAKLLFHELAHQKLYIKGDTDFNEAFADTVATVGIERWLALHNHSQMHTFSLELEREEQFINLVLEYRSKLDKLYQNNALPDRMRSRKVAIILQMRNAYQQLRKHWGNYTDYDVWFNSDINNAKIAAVSTYKRLVPDFLEIYSASGKDIDKFYSIIKDLEHCDKLTRHRLLQQGSIHIDC